MDMAAKRNFNLNKKSARSFDIEKESSSRKFDLSKESDDISVIDHETPFVDPQPTPTHRNNKMWLGIFSLIVIGLLVWWIIATIRTEDKTVEEENQTPSVEEVIEQPENVEEGTEVPAVSEEQLSEETTPTEVQETEPLTPTPSTTKEEPSVPVQSQPSKSNTATNQTQSNASINVSDDVEAEAMKVIRGDYGIGQEIKDKLGNKYQTIQNRVNELKKEGVF